MPLESLIESLIWFGATVAAALGFRARLCPKTLSRPVALRTLHRLLLSLFQAEELRRLLQVYCTDEGISVAQYLPTGDQSADALAGAALVALEQRGFIDKNFFDALVFERPRRAHEIRAVQRMFGL